MRRSSIRILILSFPLALIGAPSSRAQTLLTLAGSGPSSLDAPYSGDGGPATLAQFSTPDDLAFDAQGNLFIADANNCVIREVAAGTGLITTYAGQVSLGGGVTTGVPGFSGDGGPATSAELFYPSGLALDPQGNLFIADYYNDVVREVVAATGVIRTVVGSVTVLGGVTQGIPGYAGDGGTALSARLNAPYGLAFDGSGNLYIADSGNNVVRKVAAVTGTITTVAGSGPGGYGGDGGPATLALLDSPQRVALDPSGDLFIADVGNFAVREVSTMNGTIRTVAGSGVEGFSGDGGPATLSTNSGPDGIAIGCDGDLFMTDDGNHRIRKVSRTTGIITTVVGDGTDGFIAQGPALSPSLGHPEALAFYQDDLYGVDYQNNVAQEYLGLCPPTSTPTSTHTSLPTDTMTLTTTATQSMTPSRTPTPSPTPTITMTPTPTGTPTFSRTPTLSPTPTLTSSATPSPSPTVTPGNVEVTIALYNGAGEWIQDLTSFSSPDPIDSLTLLGGPITRLSGPGDHIDVYTQGVYVATWRGLDAQGYPLTNGVYQVQVRNRDPYGTITTVTRDGGIDRDLERIEVDLFDSAGEIVRHLFTEVDDADGSSLIGLSLSSSTFSPSLGPQEGPGLGIFLRTTTSGVTLSWNGANDAGTLASPGCYWVHAHVGNGKQGDQDLSRSLLVVPRSHEGSILAFPNLLTPRNGKDLVFFMVPGHPDWTVRVCIHALSGEWIGRLEGKADGSSIHWKADQVASGLYLAHAEGFDPSGVQRTQADLRILVIH